jgi:ABC-type taurine transport system ATPase subunit
VFLYSCQSNDKEADPKTAVLLAKDMQALPGADGDIVKEHDLMQQNVGRRKTIRNIDASHNFGKEKHAVGSLGVAFKRRLTKAHAEGKDMLHCVAL